MAIGIGDATARAACNWSPNTNCSASSTKSTAFMERRLAGKLRLTPVSLHQNNDRAKRHPGIR
jgi:hypothetical protein